MAWIALAVLAVLGVSLVMLKRPPSTEIEAADDDFDDTEIVLAAVELHAIRQRLNVAWTRIELARDASRLRRELADEMRRIELLKATIIQYREPS